MPMKNVMPMKTSALLLAFSLTAAAGMALVGSPARAFMTLDQACTKFSGKVNDAVASGNLTKARQIYAEGSKRVASHFNGATCPNVKAP
jgi:hypothetical protein